MVQKQTIYVLVTRNRNNGKKEYRVVRFAFDVSELLTDVCPARDVNIPALVKYFGHAVPHRKKSAKQYIRLIQSTASNPDRDSMSRLPVCRIRIPHMHFPDRGCMADENCSHTHATPATASIAWFD